MVTEQVCVFYVLTDAVVTELQMMTDILLQVYELNGTTHDSAWVLALYKRVITRFVSQYPDFTGARFIKTSPR